jgi:predicted dehydrogenase
LPIGNAEIVEVMSVKVGVIGVGYLGRHHARVFAEMEGVELVGVADIEKKRAEEVARVYQCRAFSDYRKLLPHVDAVSIVTPTTTHYEIARHCLREGQDLLVEKPFTVTLEESDILIEEKEGNGRIVQVGHLERFL